MKQSLYARGLAWLAVVLAFVSFSLPWATYGVMEDSTLRYHTWTGWTALNALFVQGYYGPFAVLVAVWQLAPIWTPLLLAVRGGQGHAWADAIQLGFCALTITYQYWAMLDTAQGLAQGTPTPTLGVGLPLLTVSTVMAGVARWWQTRHPHATALAPVA